MSASLLLWGCFCPIPSLLRVVYTRWCRRRQGGANLAAELCQADVLPQGLCHRFACTGHTAHHGQPSHQESLLTAATYRMLMRCHASAKQIQEQCPRWDLLAPAQLSRARPVASWHATATRKHWQQSGSSKGGHRRHTHGRRCPCKPARSRAHPRRTDAPWCRPPMHSNNMRHCTLAVTPGPRRGYPRQHEHAVHCHMGLGGAVVHHSRWSRGAHHERVSVHGARRALDDLRCACWGRLQQQRSGQRRRTPLQLPPAWQPFPDVQCSIISSAGSYARTGKQRHVQRDSKPIKHLKHLSLPTLLLLLVAATAAVWRFARALASRLCTGASSCATGTLQQQRGWRRVIATPPPGSDWPEN